MQDAEDRIESVEEDVSALCTSTSDMDKTIKMLLDKIKDLENRSRRSNLRIIGDLESYLAQDLIRLCSL